MNIPETLKIYSVSTVEVALLEIIERLKVTLDVVVDVQFHTAPQLARKDLILDDIDLLITTQSMISQLVEKEILEKSSVIELGQTEVALCTYNTSPLPEVFTVEDFFKLMIRCDEILLTEGSSGLYVQSLFRDLEFKTSLEKKYKRFATGREMMTYLGQFCRHSNSNAWIVGLGANTEILQFESIGIKYLSGLPQELKHTTTYSIGMTTHTKRSDPANQFMNHLRLSQNWTLFKKSGFK